MKLKAGKIATTYSQRMQKAMEMISDSLEPKVKSQIKYRNANSLKIN